MAFYNAQYVTSAKNILQWPKSELPEVLFVGRSNVGKSSLLNTLFTTKRLVYTGKKPGKTRLLNFFSSNGLMFVDAPGYGYAERSEKELSEYDRMMDSYLYKRENLKLIVWILDIRRLPNEDDLMMRDWLVSSDHEYLVVLNKTDKLSYSQCLKQTAIIKKALLIDEKPLVFYSTKTLQGREELVEELNKITQTGS